MSKENLNPSIEGLLRTWLPGKRWFPVKSPDFALEQVGFSLPPAAAPSGGEAQLKWCCWR